MLVYLPSRQVFAAAWQNQGAGHARCKRRELDLECSLILSKMNSEPDQLSTEARDWKISRRSADRSACSQASNYVPPLGSRTSAFQLCTLCSLEQACAIGTVPGRWPGNLGVPAMAASGSGNVARASASVQNPAWLTAHSCALCRVPNRGVECMSSLQYVFLQAEPDD